MAYEEQLKKLVLRTKRFALEIIRLHATLSSAEEGRFIGEQLIRCSTMAGAYFRDALSVKSMVEFNRKLEKGRQTLEKSGYWLELLEESGICQDFVLGALRGEAKELIAILSEIANKAKIQRRNLRELA